MRDIRTVFQIAAAWIGSAAAWFFGGTDGMLLALVLFMAVDWLTGVIAAFVGKTLSSERGFRGLCRKLIALTAVGLAHLLDRYVFGGSGILRTAVILFYLGNEGLSITENAARAGVPIPRRLKDALRQLKEREK